MAAGCSGLGTVGVLLRAAYSSTAGLLSELDGFTMEELVGGRALDGRAGLLSDATRSTA
ncbi:hypothetical protein OKW46_002173 [Paraburkholderia sp. WSM4179]|nr:hypothetical protein [Paraburkholderia sp. WSM4179]